MAADNATLDTVQDEIEDFAIELASRYRLTATELVSAMIWATAAVVAINTRHPSVRDEVVGDVGATLRGAVRSAYLQLDRTTEQLEAMPSAGRA